MITTIRPTEQPALWLAHSGDERYEGQTALGEITGIAEGYAVVSAEGEMAYMAAASVTPTLYPPLPEVGQPVEARRVYRYDDTLVMARQSHTRMHYAPEDTPALFMVYRADADEVLGWVAGEEVYVGTRRTYEGVVYECIQAHVTQSDWTPPATPALWQVVQEETGVEAWQSGTTYPLGAVVTHNDATWESRRDNNVWEPGTSDSGWLRTEPYPSAWYYLGGEGYPLDWEVLHKGSTWRNTSAGNHWEPSVWGWTKL